MSRPKQFAFPDYKDAAEQRTHLKQKLAAGFRLFGRFGFDEGIAGHITARDPERTDCFWVNPFGMSFKRIRASDLILVSHEGEVVEGDWPVNQAAFAIHSEVHAARPDIEAAAHSHSPSGRAFSTLGIGLDPLTQDSCAFFEDHSVFNDYTGVVNDPAEGRLLAEALSGYKAVILANHGLLTVGQSVDAAIWWYITMERSCGVQLAAMSAGEPKLIDPSVARGVHSQIGTDLAGAFTFHSLFDWICSVEPELLD